MEKTYTQIVSEYLAGLKYEDIPQEAIDRAKRLTPPHRRCHYRRISFAINETRV